MHDPSLHIFIDDQHVRTLFGLRREFGKLEKLPGPVLEDLPGRLACWACVLREADGLYRMWYQSVSAGGGHALAKAGVWGRGEEFGYFPERHPEAVRETQTSIIAYAESHDGVRWRKPDLGRIEWRGSKANNLVLDGSGAARQFDQALTNMDTVTVLRDEDDPDPAKRYKMMCHWETVHVWDNHPTLADLGRSDEFLRAAGKPAMLITRPLEVREPELQLNIAGHDGTARVALLDEAMNPLSGFQIEHCLPIAADAVRAPVRWRERSTLAELRGRRVHLFIQMGAGQLFAVRL